LFAIVKRRSASAIYFSVGVVAATRSVSAFVVLEPG